MAFKTIRLFWAGAYPLYEFDRLYLDVQKEGILYRVFSATLGRRLGRPAYLNPQLLYVGYCTKKEDYIARLKRHRAAGEFSKWKKQSKKPLFYSVGLVEDVPRQRFSTKLLDNLAKCLVYRLKPQFNPRIRFYKGRKLEIISEGDTGALPTPILCGPPPRVGRSTLKGA